MTPLQKAEKSVTDTHLKLSALAERREKLAAQLTAAEAEERRLLKGGTDLAALATVRGRISAGNDMIREAAAEAEGLEAELDGLEAAVSREAALSDLGAACERGVDAAKRIDARLDRIAQFLADELPLLEGEHGELLAARSDYERAGYPLNPGWALTGVDRPKARDTAEGFLTRRGFSLRGINPDGLTEPSNASAALKAAHAVYRQITAAAWIAQNLEREQARRAAEITRRQRLGLEA